MRLVGLQLVARPRRWECDETSDCRDGLECRSFQDSHGTYVSACATPEDQAVAKYSWPSLVFSWGMLAVVAVVMPIAVVARIVRARRRRQDG